MLLKKSQNILISVQRSLLQPVLLQLVPHLQLLLGDPAGITGVQRSWLKDDMAELLLRLLAEADSDYQAALCATICGGSSSASSNASSSSLGLLLSSFEAVLRHDPQQHRPGAVLWCAKQVSRVAYITADSQAALLVSSVLQQRAGQQLLLNQLFALQVSCLKHAWRASSHAHAPGVLGAVHALAVNVSSSCCSVLDALGQQHQQVCSRASATSSSSSSSSGGSCSNTAPSNSSSSSSSNAGPSSSSSYEVEGSQQQPALSARQDGPAAAAAAAGIEAAAQWVALLSRCLFVVASALEAATGGSGEPAAAPGSCEATAGAAATTPQELALLSSSVE
uniref:Uncharacterized protein n=1 Tax=Tetradesmus obliquus TaxID=3088 RepID=A0A383VG20_TETOB|eukprot:jgi/Sobl393_1/16478/SZX63860.1